MIGLTSISSSISLGSSNNDDSSSSNNESKKSIDLTAISLKARSRKFRQSIQCGDSSVRGLSISGSIIVNYNIDGKIQVWDISSSSSSSSLTKPLKQYLHGEAKEKKRSISGLDAPAEKKKQDGQLTCMATLTHKLIAENNNNDNTITIVSGSKDGYIRIYHSPLSFANYDPTLPSEQWEGPFIANEISGIKLSAIRSIAIKEVNNTIWVVHGEEFGRIGVWDYLGTLLWDFDPIIYNLKSAITSLYIHNAIDERPAIISGTKDDVICKWGADENEGLLQSKHHCHKNQSGITSVIVYQPNNVDDDEHFETVIISAGSDNCIIIWSYLNLEKLRKLEGHSDVISSLCIHSASDPFHPVIVSSSRDRTIRFWGFRSGKYFREMKLHIKNEEGSKPEPVNCIAVTTIHQDFLLISGGDDCNIRLTDFNGDELIHSFKNDTKQQTKKIGPSLCLTSTDYLQGVDSKRKLDIKSEFLCPFILESVDNEKKAVKLTSCLDNEVQTRIELDGLDNTDTDAHLTFFHIKNISSRFPSNIIALTRPKNYRTKIYEYHNARKESIADMILMNNNNDNDLNVDYDDSTSERIRSESTPRHRSESYARARFDSTDENAHKNPNNYAYLWPIVPSLRCSRIELRGHSDVVTCISFCESDIIYQNNKKKTILTAITGSADGTLMRWDISTGKMLGLVEAHKEGVSVLKSFKQIPKTKSTANDNDDNDDNINDKNEVNDSTKDDVKIIKNSKADELHQSYIVSGGRDFFVKIYAANTLDDEYSPLIEEFEHSGEVQDIAIHNMAGQDIQIVTVAADKIIRIISFNSLEIKQQINSNCVGSITSLALHSFHFGRGSKNWIIVGTSDGVTKVWDMKSEALLRELKTSSSLKEISDVAIVTLPPKQFANLNYRREPVVVSMNPDGQINLLDSYFACKDVNAYPSLTPALVRREYRWDQNKSVATLDSMSKESEKDDETTEYEEKIQLNKQKKLVWPRISNLVERCEAYKVFQENAYLFWMAIDESRSDFIDFFLRDVPEIVAYSYHDENKLCRSLLGKALHKKDLQSVRVILSCWKILISLSSKNNSLFNHYFFVTNHLHKECLVELSKRYPNEFHDFIEDLKTIPAHPCVSVNCEQAMLAPGKCLVSGVNDSAEAKELWIRILDTHYRKKKNKVKNIKKRVFLNAPVVATFLPVNYAATKDFLTCLVKTSQTLNTVSLFETDCGRFAVQFAWESYGRSLHIRSMIEYLVYLALFSISCFLFDSLHKSDNQHYSNLAWVIQAFVLSGVLYLFMLELYQARGHWTAHIVDIWNFIDVISYLTVFTGTLLRIIYLDETSSSRILLSIASLLTWLKLLYFLRGFEGTGHFVAMVFVIAYEIRFFLLVLFISLFGFAQSFYMVGYYSGTLPSSLLLLFETMMGVAYSVDFSGTVSEEYTTTLYVFYCIVIMLLLLNMLIAQMNNTYTKVAQKGFAAQFKFERAKIIIEESFLLSRSQELDPKLFPRSIHVLRRYADVEQEKYEDEKESDLANIKSIVESMKDKVLDLENRIGTAEERTIKQMNAFEKHSELMKKYLEKVEDKDKKIIEYFEKNDPIIQRTAELQETHERLLIALQDQFSKKEEVNCNPITMMSKFPFDGEK